MKKLSKRRIVMMIIIVVAMVFIIITCQREYERKEYEKKCEEAQQEMVDIAEKYVEALNNHNYDTAVSLLSDSCKEYYKDLDTMYSFVEKEKCDFDKPIDYNEFSFAVAEMREETISFSSNPEKFIHDLRDGVDLVIEFGNSEKEYKVSWNIGFVVEEDEIKIGQISRLYSQ